jgi:glycosyltransferase involved in cell wall biosynthesis
MKKTESMDKIHICYPFVEGPWGGANQFLKALRQYFRNKGVYSDIVQDAGIIVFNSHQYFKEMFLLKMRYPEKIFVHRVDGPIYLGRKKDKFIDKIIYFLNYSVADGTIFQSEWSKQKNFELGMEKNRFEITINNAPDPKLFNNSGKSPFNNKCIRLIAVSWSSNIRKGFDVFQYLDKNLDFNKYQMTFVGNSPIKFSNIKTTGVIPHDVLASVLKKHDIFIHPSLYEACSNTLLEALHCGLPAVIKNFGQKNIENMQGIEYFDKTEDIIPAIKKIAQNYEIYVKTINIDSFDMICDKYLDFISEIIKEINSSNYSLKKITLKTRVHFLLYGVYNQATNVFNTVAELLKR